MAIDPILNGERGSSVRAKLNTALSLLVPATTAAPGLQSAADKSKLDTLAPIADPGDIGAATVAQGALAESAVQPADLDPLTTRLTDVEAGLGTVTDTVSGQTATLASAVAGVGGWPLGAGYQQPILGLAGDSILANGARLQWHSSFLTWYAFTLGGYAGFRWNPTTYANGGYVYAVGGKTTAQVRAEQLPQIEARPPTILLLNSGTNNAYSTMADAEQAVADLQAVAAGALAAGVKEVWLYPILPKTNNQYVPEINRNAHLHINARMAAYAHATPGVMQLNPDYAVTIPDSLYYVAKPLVLIDGTHTATLGAYNQRRLLPLPPSRRARRTTHCASIWHATNAPWANVLGNAGRMLSGGGSLGGVAGNAAVASGWALTNTAGLTVVPSLVANGDGTYRQRLVLSGTQTDNAGRVTLAWTVSDGAYFSGLSSSTWEVELRLRVSGLSGLFMPDITFKIGGGGAFTVTGITSAAGDYAPADAIDLFVYNTVPVTATASCTGFTVQIHLAGLTTQASAGTIEVQDVGIYRAT